MLKPRSDCVVGSWWSLQGRPVRHFFNGVSLLGAQTGAHKGKPISMGDTNLGGHRIVCIVSL
jgi:hypothetical protein